MELAALKGTEKQVNWAKAIRKDRLKVWQGADPDSFQAVESTLSQQGMASWWIDSRDKSLKEVCSKLQGGSVQGGSVQGGTRPKSATKPVAPRAAQPSMVQLAPRADDGGLWETVVSATGFTRSGPTKDVVTGAVVVDATLPF